VARDDERIDELDPLQRALVHDIQFELFERLRAKKLLPVRPRHLAQVREALEVVIEEVVARYYDDLAPEWLRRESEDESGYVPWHFEMSFGLEHRDERLRLFELGFAIGRDASRLCCSPAFLASCGERPPARLRDPHAGTSIGCRPATVRRRLPSRARH
jgi:hypothetical protein